MSTLNHTCSKTGEAEIDCAACQLSQLCHTSQKKSDAGSSAPKEKETRKTDGAAMAAVEGEDDYSISTELTSKGNDYSILYLVLAAVGVMAAVIFFYKIFIL